MAFQKAKALQEAEKAVSQGKTAQAIRQYQEILDNDPSDVSLLNTVGDLYIRDRNITEGLRQFHKLAEAYVREGFNVKAIAIYRKISKVDPNSVDTQLKLAELYQLQGLSREAREQYLQATEYFKKRNQTDRALDVLRKLVQLDPENINFRNRLAVECEQSGKREDAARTHLEVAEILLRRNDQEAAETALKKAAELDPKNSKIQILRARVAIARQQPEEAERIINSSPELQSDPAGKRVLLDSYIGLRRLHDAEKLVLEVFHSNPTDLSPISTISGLLVEKGEIEEAYKLLASVADALINQNNAGPLLEALRRIWSAAPNHIPTLELIHKLCEGTADELTLPEVLEALGHAHEQSGDLDKAEAAYLKLAEREPENQNYRALLNAVQQKLGREHKPIDFPAREMELPTEETELPPEPASVDPRQESMVKEALENSDLFTRYNLTEKAIAELEKVLQVYPDQVDVHRRILEISYKGFPARGAVAASQLARIFAEHGDAETAGKYQAIASGKGALHEIPMALLSSEKGEAPLAPSPPANERPNAGSTMEFPIPVLAPEKPVAAAPAPTPELIFSDLAQPHETLSESPAEPPPPALSEQMMELDLSEDFEAMAFGFEAPAPAIPELAAPPPVGIPAPAEIVAPMETTAPVKEPTPPPVVAQAPSPVETPLGVPEPPPGRVEEGISAELDDSRIEVEFYLENGFIDEARQTVSDLEAKYPGNPFVAELRQLLNERLTGAPPAAEPRVEIIPMEVAPAEEAVVAKPPAVPEVANEFVLAEPLETSALADKFVIAERPEGPTAVDEFVVAEPALNTGQPFGLMAEQPPIEVAPAEPEAMPPAPNPAPVEEPSHEEWELPTSYAVTPESKPEIDSVVPPPATEQQAPAPAALVAPPLPAESAGMDMLGDLAGDLASSLDELKGPGDASTAQTADFPAAAPPPTAGPSQGAAQLSGLLAEMEDPGSVAAAAARDDPETHYNLGVAFREMGLLDEAIGEFQKVVRGAGKESFPTNFLQACSLLAICFMEKKMPAIAVRWYKRALETPGLEEEAMMALQYDLGLAYEQAGDSRNALERFTEVYSQNIDFRDVAEKIRELQQKA